MYNERALYDRLEDALYNLPYDFDITGYEDGDDEAVFGEYSREITFKVGSLFEETIDAGGWVEARRDEGEEVTIAGIFVLARQGDFKTGRILPEGTAVLANYDQRQQRWHFEIDQM